MNWSFLMKGKAKDVFKALAQAAWLEQCFGRLVEPLEEEDFGRD